MSKTYRRDADADPRLDMGELDMDDESTEPAFCPACGSIESVPLGHLGHTLWLRCRDCGWDRAEKRS